MKIKTKLTISFCIIIFVPVMLAVAVLFGFQKIQLKEIEENYGLQEGNAMTISGSVQIMSRLTNKEYDELIKAVEDEPDELLSEEYLKNFDKKLKAKYSYLVVSVDGEIYYNGGDDNSKILARLKKVDRINDNSEINTYVDSEDDMLVKQLDAIINDKEVSIFILTSTGNMLPEMKSLITQAAIAIIVILVLTASLLIVWIYGSIITPIKKLQVAAENIKNGNLEFELDYKNSDGELADLCLSFEQMRQRLKDNAEEKLHNETENRTLISNIAHDLKTPITAVKGYSEGIIDGVANTPEKVDKYVRTIYNKANEMDTLINELTLYSKFDTDRIPYNFAKINVDEYFNDCIEEIGLDLEAKNVGLAYYNYASKDTIIIADPEQLRRVINNIIGNSVKYMNKSRSFINFRIKDVGDFIQVEIEDNGKGIAQKDLPYIFDRFYRADSSRNSATGGSGIGLSIVKKIIEDHGGKIWASSKEDTGTVMYFVIRKYQEVNIQEEHNE